MNMNAGADVGRVTLADVVNAASDTLAAVEAGTLRPDDVERRAVDACRELFGVVGTGADDPLWSLHGDVVWQYLAAGGVTAAELREWAACRNVGRPRAASRRSNQVRHVPQTRSPRTFWSARPRGRAGGRGWRRPAHAAG